eukprot:CAMPEP_0185819232 /NCGR_PEP_ID=MMETSP1322-20130828/21903_1 /TAXON_ID=265543 /ORGANISM="Minutocellus polymorphus, Strain RCC2270" /LENGTH=63 /DNA_ID=CAMNT_0028516427 /DNA_START=254 /DNA_END=445 /DNA_ORIENTATION=-
MGNTPSPPCTNSTPDRSLDPENDASDMSSSSKETGSFSEPPPSLDSDLSLCSGMHQEENSAKS